MEIDWAPPEPRLGLAGEWNGASLYLKLLAAHLGPEAPFQPKFR